MKISKKTAAKLIFLIPVCILFISAILLFLQNKNNECNKLLNRMYINKSQQYLESQKILFERTMSVSERTVSLLEKNQEAIESDNARISQGYVQYRDFLENMKEYDVEIDENEQDCNSFSFQLTVVTIVLIIFTAIQSISIIWFEWNFSKR